MFRPLVRRSLATLASGTAARTGGRMPHSKQRVSDKRPSFAHTHTSRNAPSETAKYLRHAERVAWELGVVEELEAFDAAAAAFPNPPPLVAATCVALAAARGAASAGALLCRLPPPLPPFFLPSSPLH